MCPRPREALHSNGHEDVTFARNLGLFDATMIGVGAMVGAGIFVLTGIAAGESGPASLLAFALNGLVTLLTAFSYAELASAIPEAGGGYSFIRRAFPGAIGFLSGWMLWFAYTVACSLYAIGFGGYFWEVFHQFLPEFSKFWFGLLSRGAATGVVILLVGLFFVGLNMRGTWASSKMENVITLAKIAILTVFVAYGLKRTVELPAVSLSNFEPFFPKGFSGVMVAMGLTFIAFEGYDLIATVSEEVKDPERNIPRATFIAVAVVVTLYLLIVFVSLAAIHVPGGQSWAFLGQYREVAVVKAAENFMPRFGVALIVGGGLLSTMSALNATVMASSRVAFSMSRDSWLPAALSRIHPLRRTPHLATAATGLFLLAIALSLPLEVVGSATSVMFLLCFALVNVSVIILRRKHPEIPRRFSIPFYPLLPLLGVGTSTWLALYQYRFDPRTWYVTGAWIAVGSLLYLVHYQRVTAEPPPPVLEAAAPSARAPRAGYRVLVPIGHADFLPQLLDLALPIARARQGEVVAMGMAIIPRQLPIQEGFRIARHMRPLLRRAAEYGRERGVPVRTHLRIAHRRSEGILAAAAEERADLILLEWRGYTEKPYRTFGQTVDIVIRQAPCDLAVAKLGQSPALQRILLPTAGGPHARLAARLAPILAQEFDAQVTSAHVVPRDAIPAEQEAALLRIEATLEGGGFEGPVERRLIEAGSVSAGLIRASREYDLVLIGSAREGFFRQVLFGVIPERVARHSKATVLIVKGYEGRVKGWVKKVFG